MPPPLLQQLPPPLQLLQPLPLLQPMPLCCYHHSSYPELPTTLVVMPSVRPSWPTSTTMPGEPPPLLLPLLLAPPEGACCWGVEGLLGWRRGGGVRCWGLGDVRGWGLGDMRI